MRKIQLSSSFRYIPQCVLRITLLCSRSRRITFDFFTFSSLATPACTCTRAGSTYSEKSCCMSNPSYPSYPSFQAQNSRLPLTCLLVGFLLNPSFILEMYTRYLRSKYQHANISHRVGKSGNFFSVGLAERRSIIVCAIDYALLCFDWRLWSCTNRCLLACPLILFAYPSTLITRNKKSKHRY